MHNPDTYLDQWKRGQELAEAMVPLLGKLFRHKSTEVENVDLVVFLTVTILQEQRLSEAEQELFDMSATPIESIDARPVRSELDYSPSQPKY